MSTASPSKRAKTSRFAQLIGPSFLRLQMLGFAGLSSQDLDLRFIDTTAKQSIQKSVKTVITTVKNETTDAKLRFVSRDSKKRDPDSGALSTVNYGYQAGTVLSLIHI